MSNTFNPIGSTRVIGTTTTSSNITITTAGTNAFQFNNTSGNVIFVAVGTGSAVIPLIDGTVGNSIMINHDDKQVLRFNTLGSSTNANVVISAIAASGTGNLYITPGVV
jgi:ABC-type tungstate transport system permease subunit